MSGPATSAICGVLTSLATILGIFFILVSHGKFFPYVLVTNLIELFQVAVVIFVKKNFVSAPGLFMSVSAITISSIFYKYISRIDSQQKLIKSYSELDNLTGLLNRYGLISVAESYIKDKNPFYLIVADLDNFKTINDVLGHDIGDEAIINIASNWTNLTSYADYSAARIGGDEFGIILPCRTESTMNNFVTEMFNSLPKNSFNYITTSIGVVNYPNDAGSIRQLFSYADTAMYKAKSNGKNTWYRFNALLQHEIEEEYNTKKYIQASLAQKTFEVIYQPQYNTKSETIYGFESLLRLKKDGVYIPTPYIIGIAEKSQIIFDIDLYVLDTVTKDWAEIVKIHPDLVISVNISGKHFNIPHFFEDLMTIINRNSFNPSNLCIEITESAFINSINLAESLVSKIKNTGIKIAIDDFGTGYSSLSYLSSFKADHIKIEKSFTDTIIDDPSEDNIVNITTKVGHLVGASVIIEGVETQDQLNFAAKTACDIIQGYYYSKPVTLDRAIELVE